MSYQINLGQWNSVFAVPSALVDRHIKLASQTQLRVILYLLRHSGENIGTESLCNALSISAEEAQNAAGMPVRLSLRVGEPPKASPQENLKNLLKFGSQFDNIEIK